MANAKPKVSETYLKTIAKSITGIIDDWIEEEAQKLLRSLEADLFFSSITVADLSFEERLILSGIYVKMSDPTPNLLFLDEDGGEK